ncbi:MAG TPA: hypothetical protein VGN14_07230 [Candidatus Elarobacter sp.]
MRPPLSASLLTALLISGAAPLTAAGQPEPSPSPVLASASGVAAGTRIRFHVDRTLSSATSKTGENFGFALLDPVTTTGGTVIPAGARGSGTLLLAGKSGTGGHEGDLTLRLDSLALPDGRHMKFEDQHLEINGRNRKAASGVLGFVPIVGYGAMLIRGSDIEIGPNTPIETVLARGAIIPRP